MNDIQYQFVKNILTAAPFNPRETGSAFAPSNIALCKYWGKRDATLNLPVNSSLSISLGQRGTQTDLRPRTEAADRVYLNGQPADPAFAHRVTAFLDLFRPLLRNTYFEVRTKNNIPTAAGLASSASGFAALVLALDAWAGWKLDRKSLSMLARLGSGSAARSVYDGFVQWNAGEQSNGMDSFAEPLSQPWDTLRIGILELSAATKPVGSREGMERTRQTASLYSSWPVQAAADLVTLRTAIAEQDFPLLGQTAEHNALSMHATMLAAWPPLLYFQPETIAQIHRVHQLRADGLPLYLTIDAGPNLKLLFCADQTDAVQAAFPALQIIRPFKYKNQTAL